MSAIDRPLQKLRRDHPEWGPWLGLVQRTLDESANGKWDAAVPARSGLPKVDSPLLSESTLGLKKNILEDFFAQLVSIASRSGIPKLATLRTGLRNQVDLCRLFDASLNQDAERLKLLAADSGADPEAFQSVAILFCVPFLQACSRHWAALIPRGWTRGCCPVCGGWPALTEVRGIERSRYFRCGRCGAGWQVHCLFCPYCGITDHEQLLSLVPEQDSSNGVIEACRQCLGYVKTFTTLQPSPAVQIMLDDLASVSLDIAALQQGYRRPERPAYDLSVTVELDRPAGGPV